MQAGTYDFKVGDKAIYPKQGVTEVVSIEQRKIGSTTMEFYVLKPLDAKNNDRIRVAVAQAKKVGLRPPISETDIQEIFALLEEQPDISLLVLGASTSKRGPGPLISALTTKDLSQLHIPMVLVPDSMTQEEIDSVT